MSTLDLGVRHRLSVVNPATGEAIGHIPAGGAPEAHDAVRAARAAHGAWARTDPGARGSLLKAAARRLRECARELAELQTRDALVLREPRGIVAILMPWSDPLSATCGALAAALVAGNAVVLKPSQKAPLAAERVAELLDLGGILQILHGDERAARPLATHPGVDLVMRPGEEAAGSHLAIIDAGVDPEWAAAE